MLTNCLTASTHLSSTVFQLFKLQVQKIAVFTYCSLHFCFPWRRPCDYHAICCMDGKTIQGLPNPSQQVPIYHGLYVCIILYANDILLLAPSVNALQLLLSTCELELRKLDLFISSNPRRHYRHLTLTLIRGFLSGGGLSGHFGVT